jgi:hypothetical protein
MTNTSAVREHMEVIGAEDVHVGTVDRLEGDRIKLAKKDSGQGSHEGHSSLYLDSPHRRYRGQ